MSFSEKPFEHFDELGRLLSLLCEGELSAQESARLREMLVHSPQARRYFLEYMELHAELHWAAGMGRQAEPTPPMLVPQGSLGLDLPSPARVRIRKGLWQWWWLVAAGGLLLAVGLGLLVLWGIWKPGHPPEQRIASAPVARWGRKSLPEWEAGSAQPDSNQPLAPGQTIALQRGFAELIFEPNTRVVLEAPARLVLLGPRQGEVRLGRLSVQIPPGEDPLVFLASSFLLQAEAGQVGLLVEQNGQAEVHVFSGQVTLKPSAQGLRLVLRPEGSLEGAPEVADQVHQRIFLQAGQAVRILSPAGPSSNQLELVEIFPDLPGFVFRLPAERWAAGISRLRAAVASHPALIHHYPFEGSTAAQRRQDHSGQLHLVEVVMSGGRGETQPRFVLAPPGADQWAFHPVRGLYAGNRIGAALQTEGSFSPPENLTIELLANFGGFSPREKDPVAALIASRTNARQVSFFLAVAGQGQLVQLLDAEEPWLETEGALIPGEWYYLATTFRTDPQTATTLVNTYLANLSRDQKTLQWVAKNRKLVGIPAPSRLGIGKGFDPQGRHAYPWPGLIDEVAIYRAILDQQTLQQHLNLLLEK